MSSCPVICDWNTKKETGAEIIPWPGGKESDPELDSEIERAEALLQSEEELSAHSKDTLERVRLFLRMQARGMKARFRKIAPVPAIELGPNGSFDLHWKMVNWELLVNFPADPNQRGSFYADDYGSQTSRGHFDQKVFNLVIAAWTMRD
jgi:hypothetical protein